MSTTAPAATFEITASIAEWALAAELFEVGHKARNESRATIGLPEIKAKFQDLSPEQQAAWVAIARHVGSNTAEAIRATIETTKELIG